MRLANLKSKLLACFALLTMLVGQVAAIDMQNCQMHMSPSLTLDKPAAKHQTLEHKDHDHAMHAEHGMNMMEDNHQAADSNAHDCCKTAKAECQCPHQICHNAGIIITELAIEHIAATPNKITKSFEPFISQPSTNLYRPPIFA